MNKDVRDRWTARLRDPESKQYRGRLAETHGPGRCCLGHLCDLAVEDGLIFRAGSLEGIRYANELFSLPLSVMEWAELSETNSEVDLREEVYGCYTLAALNDAGRLSLSEIADVIEAQF